MLSAEPIARLILRGFQRHYQLFSALTDAAGRRFCEGDWAALQRLSRERIDYYDARVKECIEHLRHEFDDTQPNDDLWQAVKITFTELLSFHPQAELAESFYNSVFCALFDRRYYQNQYIFVATTIEGRIPVPVEAEYRSYFPVLEGVPATLQAIIEEMGFADYFNNLPEDVERLRHAFADASHAEAIQAHQLRIDVLKHPFYRNKAAYVVGRIVTVRHSYPFIVPVLRNAQGRLYADALLTDPQQMAVIFSFARAYFMVRAQAPSALVRFLQGLLPRKTKADLYAAIGLHKQGKTEFYRELLHHFAHSDDQLVTAPGVRGLVMMVFTLPSFPYVFKVIRDKFGTTKEFGRDTVVARYQLVKRHDRVGRMADTIEYSNVALPLERFSDDLLSELKSSIGNSMEIDGDTLVIRHLYIEKRLTPLNLFLDYASDDETRAILDDYGQAIKDMLAANIFPGDMLLKNFGVTRNRRVVFYDYDEVQYLTDMNFRALPIARNYHDLLLDSDAHSVAPNDVFPEQLGTYVFAKPALRELFIELHSDLLDPAYWQAQKEAIVAGEVSDIFPYPDSVRFKHYNPCE